MSVIEKPVVKDAVRVTVHDNVAVALCDLPRRTELDCGGARVSLEEGAAKGHKIALVPIKTGETVIKYGQPIGLAIRDIAPGHVVHSDNLKTALSVVEEYAYAGPPEATPPAHASLNLSFMGYRRADGRVGVRNEIWIIATVGCVEKVCERIAQIANARFDGEVDGVHAITHPFGCSQLGDDLNDTRSVLAALASHPNAGGVVFVGLGCESNQLDKLLSAAPKLDPQRVRSIVSQSVDDEIEAGLRAVAELVAVARQDEREPCAASSLVIGLKCGGSDGMSGLTANPLVGRITDRIVVSGGSTVLTEIPEIFGAERLLMARARDRKAFDKLVAVVNDFKRYFVDHGQPVHENPSPGNIAGGITTLEEKSLGAVQKAGGAIVADVIRYGERVREHGLTILEAPGNDAVSSTALAAAGATVILFTTGRGTPLGFPVPTLKISSNTALAERKPRWIDYDAGAIASGQSLEEAEEGLFKLILETASGRPTRNEENGERSIAIWKRGVTL